MVVAEETLLGAFGKPGIGAFLLEGFEDAGVDLFVLQDLAVLVGEDADRHAPGALTRKHPVRALPSIMARRRFWPAAGTKRVSSMAFSARERSVVPSQGLVHVDEPLRRVAEDDRLLRAPGMRIGMLQAAAGKQVAQRSAP
jgi:hypothetical protein